MGQSEGAGPPFSPAEEDAIREFGSRLRGSGLYELLGCYGPQRPVVDSVRLDLPLLPRRLKALAEFCVLGQAVPTEEVEQVLSRELLRALSEAGIVVTTGDRVDLGGLVLVLHFGIPILCEPPTPKQRFYYGGDSVALGRLLFPARGDVLDVCAGVGTQGLLCAQTADHVVAIEQEAEVARLFGFNALVNGAEDKIELRIGETLGPLNGETFDRICCNPPLLPIPEQVPYPVPGDGGPDGLSVVRPLLQALPRILREDGRCHVIGTILGDGSGPPPSPCRS